MRERVHFMGEGYAAQLRDKIEKGASAYTYISGYDYTVLKSKLGYLRGIELIQDVGIADPNFYRIELMLEHPQGFGNSFDTHLIVNNAVPAGSPKFAFPYTSEEMLFYQIPEEDGILLSEEGEFLIC